ncbi:MAG TPA: hypothetical protein VHG89_01245 [Verrucomicrobiae bacterium]|nr:hypothetical protein [Verrucomicrobiae bacterium]
MSSTNANPIQEIGRSVLAAAYECSNSIKPKIGFLTKEENEARRPLILFEFAYFFLHMTSRYALANLGDAKRIELQEIIGPLVAECSVESVCGHWPSDLKVGIKGEFFENLNKADFEYANCNCLVNPDDPFSQKALLVKLAQNVTNLCANPTDKELIWKVIETSFEHLKQTDLEKLVIAAKDSFPGKANN